MKSTYRFRLLAGSILMALAVTGCGIPSVYPLYEPQDLIYESQLSGKWQHEKGKIYHVYNIRDFAESGIDRNKRFELQNPPSSIDSLVMEIERDDEFLKDLEEQELGNIYLVLEPSGNSKEDAEVYLAGLLSINQNYYLDLYKYHPFQDMFSYPVHIFVKVDLEENRLIMHEFREQWLKDLIKNRQIRIKHEVSFDNFLLTASSSELKRFIAKYGDDPEAYSSDTNTYTRILSE